jgi:hypothetical protein
MINHTHHTRYQNQRVVGLRSLVLCIVGVGVIAICLLNWLTSSFSTYPSLVHLLPVTKSLFSWLKEDWNERGSTPSWQTGSLSPSEEKRGPWHGLRIPLG